MTARLRVAAVSKAFPDGGNLQPVLSALSFEAGVGECIVLWGPSGSGKTTLLNLIAGLLPVDDGCIALHCDGRWQDYGTDPELARRLRRRRFGYVFQSANLVPTLTVAENLRLPLALAGRQDLREAAEARAIRLGLFRRLDAFPETLSGGERQRAAVARALAHEPLLVLADEPTGSLDARRAAEVADLLWHSAAELGTTLIVASHDPTIASRADRVIELREAGAAAS